MKTYCSHCGRESANDMPMNASQKRREASCGRDLSAQWEEECAGYAKGFAAGRRAAFKEVLKLAKASMSHAYGLDEFNRAIRAALKVKS